MRIPRVRALVVVSAVALALVLTAYLGTRPVALPAQHKRETASQTNGRAKPITLVTDTVQARSTDVWPFRLNGLTHARVTVQTAQPSDLECKLFDPAGNALELRPAFSDPCRFAWTPQRTGAYRVEIRNVKSRAVAYTVTVR